jgi:hypothetical protein
MAQTRIREVFVAILAGTPDILTEDYVIFHSPFRKMKG